MIEVHREFSRGRRAEGLGQDKSGRICSFFVICDLVRRKRNFITLGYFKFSGKVNAAWGHPQYIRYTEINP